MSKTGYGAAVRGALLALAILAGAVPAVARQDETIRDQWSRPVTPFRIAGNVYYVGVKQIAAYLITTPQGHILIDGGYEESAPRILASIQALGFKPRDVKILLITHAHSDHAGGLAALKAATGARLLALSAERQALEEGRHIGEYDYGESRFTPVRVDRLIRDGEVVRLGAAALTVHWTPGHTKGCTTFTLPLVDQGRRHTAVFFCSTTVGGNRLVGNRVYPGIVTAFRQTFLQLKGMRADIFLPNHPGFAKLEEKQARVRPGQPNPFVDPGEFQRHLDQAEAAFEAELVRQKGASR